MNLNILDKRFATLPFRFSFIYTPFKHFTRWMTFNALSLNMYLFILPCFDTCDSNFLLNFLSRTLPLICPPSNILLANVSHDNICSCTSFISDRSFIAPASLMTSRITSHPFVSITQKEISFRSRFLSERKKEKRSTGAHVSEVNVNSLKIDRCTC